MGRRKRYDRAELVADAMELFRDHGFAGTSTQMLVERLGVNRNTMYAEFGSKQALFDAALERYDDTVMTRSFGPLERPGAGLDSIREVFERYAGAGAGAAAGRGCLLCNTAVELGPRDPSGRELVRRYFERLQGAFANALAGARAGGRLEADVDVDDEARFLTASMLGIFVLVRAGAPAEAVEAAARVAARHVESLGSGER